MPKGKFVIGLDFDNTLVSYDDAMYQAALELKLISRGIAVQNKKQIRDYIRKLPSGEIKWQILQAEVYGKRMHKAKLMDGAKEFLKNCKGEGIKTFIISHKTKYAAQDKEKVNLQEVALNWMKENHFFDKSSLGLLEDRVYFEVTRNKKVARIKTLKCTHFVDDLLEIFHDKAFPQEAVQMLFSPLKNPDENLEIKRGIRIFRSWRDINNYFFVNLK